ncbi:MAG: 1,4-alpha-glucan branching enzyme, partial [Octadecabacter sp.]|nr:1,4-alpha-glucan branching enzyme [Octadecabacter sp.]
MTHSDVDALNAGLHAQPFDVLGPHKSGRARWVAALQPDAVAVEAVAGSKPHPLARLDGDVFSGPVPGKAYKLRVTYADGTQVVMDDVYGFGPVLSEFDKYLLGEGTHKELWRVLGAHVCTHEK